MNTKRKPWMNWMLFTASLVLVFVLGIVISSIVERKTEAKYAYTPQNEISEFESPSDIMTPSFLISLTVLGLLPILARKILKIRKNKMIHV